MTTKNTQNQGFTAIELLITLFIAAAFLISGYQLFSVIIKSGGQARAKALATNAAYDYLQRYKTTTNDPCVEKTLMGNEAITIDSIADVTMTISVSCPYADSPSISKIDINMEYNNPKEYINLSTLNKGSCPTGFILVPGSAEYNTNDFCVMKYEAKVDTNGDGIGETTQTTGYNTWPANTHPISETNKITSSAEGYPIARIDQNTAIAAAQNPNFINNCDSSCHLITEAEWMTIAQNVTSVKSNWSNNSVGGGYIFSGHNDGSPANALTANIDDNEGYQGTGNSSTDTTITNSMVGASQRRTLKLTNGEVIWDFAGNLFEWTSGKTNGTSAQQPGVTGNNFGSLIDWDYIDVYGSLEIDPNPYESSSSLFPIGMWYSTQGIGQLFSSTTDTALRGIIRGGGYSNNIHAGVYGIDFQYAPSFIDQDLGFRVVKSIN